MVELRSIEVPAEAKGQRLDLFLAQFLPDTTRAPCRFPGHRRYER